MRRPGEEDCAMSFAWRLGRIGPMLITLNYTWLPVGALALWILALLWLPRHLGAGPSATTWLLAAAIGVVYLLGLLLAEAARTALCGGFSRAWPREAQVFPFGAAAPYPTHALSEGRGALVSLAGPVVLAALSGVYAALGALAAGHAPAWLDAALRALALGHAGVAALNLLPGLPLAGGWLLVSGLRWGFLGADRAIRVADRVGAAIALLLLLAGGAQVIAGGDWRLALGLLALAWIMREGAASVESQMLGWQMADGLKAGEVMQPLPRAVRADDSLSAAMRQTARLHGVDVVPVTDAAGVFVGLLPLEAADRVLQGKWPRTPVAALMQPAAALTPVEPETRLPEVLAALGHSAPPPALAGEDAPSHVGYVPVMDHGTLRGVIGWDQVEDLDRVAAQAGMEEAAALEARAEPARPRLALTLLAALATLVLLALVGARVLEPVLPADAAPTSPAGGPGVAFTNPIPAQSALLPRGDTQLGIHITSPTPITAVSMTLDGQPLDVTLSPPEGLEMQASAPLGLDLLGPHTIAVSVQREDGPAASFRWTVQVVRAASPPQQ
jgi:hypothetical protein